MMADHRVVHLDAEVDEPLRVGPPASKALARGRIQQERVGRPVHLNVGAAQADELVHLAAQDVDRVAQVGVARRIGTGRFVRVVVGRRVERADQRRLRRAIRPPSQVCELLGAQMTQALEARDHHGALEEELVAMVVGKGMAQPPNLSKPSIESMKCPKYA
jgi:hypothetical protein